MCPNGTSQTRHLLFQRGVHRTCINFQSWKPPINVSISSIGSLNIIKKKSYIILEYETKQNVYFHLDKTYVAEYVIALWSLDTNWSKYFSSYTSSSSSIDALNLMFYAKKKNESHLGRLSSVGWTGSNCSKSKP